MASSDENTLLKWWPILMVVGLGIGAFFVDQYRIEANAQSLGSTNLRVDDLEDADKEMSRSIRGLEDKVKDGDKNVALELQRLRYEQQQISSELNAKLDVLIRGISKNVSQ